MTPQTAASFAMLFCLMPSSSRFIPLLRMKRRDIGTGKDGSRLGFRCFLRRIERPSKAPLYYPLIPRKTLRFSYCWLFNSLRVLFQMGTVLFSNKHITVRKNVNSLKVVLNYIEDGNDFQVYRQNFHSSAHTILSVSGHISTLYYGWSTGLDVPTKA